MKSKLQNSNSEHNDTTCATYNAVDCDVLGDEELVNVSWKQQSHPQQSPEPMQMQSRSPSCTFSKINQSLHSNHTINIAKQYGYQYEFNSSRDDKEYADENDDDDDDGDGDEFYYNQEDEAGQDQDQRKNPSGVTSSASASASASPATSILSKIVSTINTHNIIDEDQDQYSDTTHYKIHLLGKTYHPINDYTLRREDETNLFWFSYRCDFIEISPYNITSDAGWGCMLRSIQMLLCQALKVHYVGREWKSPKSTGRKRNDLFVRDLCMWFADFPSSTSSNCESSGSWYSLHNMVAAGYSKYDVLPGEWFGPGIASHVVRDLVELHERSWIKQKKYNEDEDEDEDEDEEDNDKEHSCLPSSSSSLSNNYQKNCIHDNDIGDNMQHKNKIHAIHHQQQHHHHRRNNNTTATFSTTNKSSSAAAITTATEQASYQRHKQPVMRVYVAPEGCVYRKEIEKLMTKDYTKDDDVIDETSLEDNDESYEKVDFKDVQNTKTTTTNNNSNKNPLLLSHPLADFEQHHNQLQQQAAETTNHNNTPWDTGLLILIPLRLGLKTFNTSSYKIPLSHILSFPQSVGFVGGSPRHALYFFGSNSDGSKVYGLDPHTVQRAPRRRKVRPEDEVGYNRKSSKSKYQIQLTDEYIRSLSCPTISSINIAKIDPSLSLGFYIRDKSDFESFCKAVEDVKSNDHTKNYPSLFSLADVQPDYNADLSSAMMDMMEGGGSSSFQMDDDADNNTTDVDDDFVML